MIEINYYLLILKKARDKDLFSEFKWIGILRERKFPKKLCINIVRNVVIGHMVCVIQSIYHPSLQQSCSSRIHK